MKGPLYSGHLLFEARMAKPCIVTGKTRSVGNNVSHSNQKTKRVLRPNVTKRRLLNPATGKMTAVTISARGLRTLKKWQTEGKAYDLRTMA